MVDLLFPVARTAQHPVVRPLALAVCLALSLGGCSVTRVAPPAEPAAPTRFIEEDAWERAPAASPLPQAWWTVFHDAQLDALMNHLPTGNINLQALALQVRAAQATVSASQQAFLPSVGLNASASRNATVNTGNPSNGGNEATLGKSVQMGATASWELDLWGRLGQAREVAQAQSLASQADLSAALLSAQATFVQTYLSWRSTQVQTDVLTRTAQANEKALEITQARYQGGMVTRADVLQADTQLQTVRAQLADVRAQAGQLRQSLAGLLGTTAEGLPLESRGDATAASSALLSLPEPPPLPTLLPSQVLSQRPDVQAARQRVVAAYTQIGVTDAAWLPSFDLAASAGYKGSTVASLLSAPHLYWSLGPSVAASLLDGGQRQLASQQARINGEASSLAYRQVVLNAIQEVEGNLILARELAQEQEALDRARLSAQQNLDIVLAQYGAGTVSYLAVTTAQAALLNSELSWLAVRNRQLAASTVLLKNLGGDWSTASPTAPR